AHLALAPAEHEDVHRRVRLLDVVEDPGEKVLPLGPRVDRRRRRPRVGNADVVGLHAGADHEALGRELGSRRRDRSPAARPARLLDEREDLLVYEEEEACEQEPEDAECHLPPAPLFPHPVASRLPLLAASSAAFAASRTAFCSATFSFAPSYDSETSA